MTENNIEEKELLTEALNLTQKAHSAWIKGNILDAITFYNQALEIFKELGRLTEMANILEKLGDIYHLRQKFDQALKAYKACLDICENFEDEVSTAIIAEKIVFAYKEQRQYEKMLPYLYRILEIAEKYRDPHRAGRALVGIGDAYANLGQLEKAKEAYALALKIFNEIGSIEQRKILEEHLKNLE
ncbi:MAG: tetratricopeptide repeat protein [Caldimicrobium sp.]